MQSAKRSIGRPRAWTDPEDLQRRIEEYFESLIVFKQVDDPSEPDGKLTIVDREDPPTMAGLAFHLGVSRRTLVNYDDPKFASVIARAKAFIEQWLERELYTRQGSTNGLQFGLAMNFGWQDADEKETGGAFSQQVIAPAQVERTAIPRWEPEE